MQEVPFFYLSARAYAKQTGIGEAEVKKQLLKGELEGFTTNNQYKVKVTAEFLAKNMRQFIKEL